MWNPKAQNPLTSGRRLGTFQKPCTGSVYEPPPHSTLPILPTCPPRTSQGPGAPLLQQRWMNFLKKKSDWLCVGQMAQSALVSAYLC
jgi:hypothetical protein